MATDKQNEETFQERREKADVDYFEANNIYLKSDRKIDPKSDEFKSKVQKMMDERSENLKKREEMLEDQIKKFPFKPNLLTNSK